MESGEVVVVLTGAGVGAILRRAEAVGMVVDRGGAVAASPWHVCCSGWAAKTVGITPATPTASRGRGRRQANANRMDEVLCPWQNLSDGGDRRDTSKRLTTAAAASAACDPRRAQSASLAECGGRATSAAGFQPRAAPAALLRLAP